MNEYTAKEAQKRELKIIADGPEMADWAKKWIKFWEDQLPENRKRELRAQAKERQKKDNARWGIVASEPEPEVGFLEGGTCEICDEILDGNKDPIMTI